ncbi:hypothetical protein VNO77_05834 [Canavalia gladiata]|uniref:F-box domain-containing protein n=1 Tax=Canavalia gladiata TaxID=3824 RepID=A0AAN9N5M3_CANGL
MKKPRSRGTRRAKKNMVVLPQDLIIRILLRLPVKSLVRFKCVSKSWLSLISDPDFALSHYELAAAPAQKLLVIAPSVSEVRSRDLNASFHDDSASVELNLNLPFLQNYHGIIGSCRGYLLFDCNSSMYLWNPSTGVHKQIPSSPIASNLNLTCSFLCGFGYDPSRDDYLVVQASYEPNVVDVVTRVEIFSLRANTWTEMEGTDLTYMNPSDDPIPRHGSLINGAIHWLAFRSDISVNVIVAFDLTERSFSEIPLPDDVDQVYDFNTVDLWVFGGFLSLWAMGDETDIWVMQEYKVHSSWTKTFAVSLDAIPTQYFSPICISNTTGDIVGVDGRTGLVKCDHNGQLLEHCIFGDEAYGWDAVIYTESLLQLPGHHQQPQEEINN